MGLFFDSRSPIVFYFASYVVSTDGSRGKGGGGGLHETPETWKIIPMNISVHVPCKALRKDAEANRWKKNEWDSRM